MFDSLAKKMEKCIVNRFTKKGKFQTMHSKHAFSPAVAAAHSSHHHAPRQVAWRLRVGVVLLGVLFVGLWILFPTRSSVAPQEISVAESGGSSGVGSTQQDALDRKKSVDPTDEQKRLPIREGAFRGAIPWRTPRTVHADLLMETPWVRLEDHTVAVLSPNGQTKTVTNWKWIDIADQVNVLVSISTSVLGKLRAELKATTRSGQDIIPLLRTHDEDEKLRRANQEHGKKEEDDEELFLLFQQEKYGYLGTSFAVVGGLIEPGENADEAALREVHEELGLNRCESLLRLGTFRTDVNRGGGFINSFFARRCTLDVTELRKKQGDRQYADLEQQLPVALSSAKLKEVVLSGIRDAAAVVGAKPHVEQLAASQREEEQKKRQQQQEVKEVKWSNTIALALLHLKE